MKTAEEVYELLSILNYNNNSPEIYGKTALEQALILLAFVYTNQENQKLAKNL